MSQDSGQSPVQPSSQGVAEPPRPVTPRVRRRLWAEPMVRGWLLFVVALLLGSIFLAIRSTMEWVEETNVVRNGVSVQAVAWHLGGARVVGMSLAQGAQVSIEYTYEGKKYTASGQLHKTGQAYLSMQPFTIRIDPKKPEAWTNREDVPPVAEKMMGVGIMLIVAAICAVVMFVQRHRARSLWIHGDLVNARIIGRSQPALAPNSSALRCAIREGRTDHLVTVYVPQNLAPTDDGATIELVASANRARALALVNYHP